MLQVGKTGSVIGVELRAGPLALARASMRTMLASPECAPSSPPVSVIPAVRLSACTRTAHPPLCRVQRAARARRYAQQAAPVSLEQGNAFILPQHEGKFDRVHVGGLCAAAKLPALLALLKPAGGRIVVPCGAELLAITVSNGRVVREALATVKFGALETPTDAAIVMGHLSLHRAARLAPTPLAAAPPPPLRKGAAAAASADASPRGAASAAGDDLELDVASACSCTSFARPAARAASLGLSSRTSSARLSFSSASCSPPTGGLLAALRRRSLSAAPRPADDEPPPEPDCVVRGAGFEVPARASVLQAQCGTLRAQVASGMADAAAAVVTLPADFDEAPVKLALEFLHTGAADLDEETALPTLAVAGYLAAPPLAAHCTAFLIRHLRALPTAGAVDAAAQLHVYAAEHGVDDLAAFCATFLAVHFTQARAAPSFALLGAVELGAVLDAMAGERALLLQRLAALAAPPPPFIAAEARD